MLALLGVKAMKLLKCCQGAKQIISVWKNQSEEVNQPGKLKGEILKNEGNSVGLEVLFFEKWMKKVILIVRQY